MQTGQGTHLLKEALVPGVVPVDRLPGGRNQKVSLQDEPEPIRTDRKESEDIAWG